MDAFDRRGLLNFLWFTEDFERSRLEFVAYPHRGFRQRVRQAPKPAQQAIRDARAAAPDGLVAFCTALAPHFPVYASWLECVEQHDLAG
jgi:hypothetical protein